ncbi:MAG: SLBB domain-containing protein [Chitinivibrionales bacterium]|nr:SLBB domain-containing protein [Chitinivibrionales bacterium]
MQRYSDQYSVAIHMPIAVLLMMYLPLFSQEQPAFNLLNPALSQVAGSLSNAQEMGTIDPQTYILGPGDGLEIRLSKNPDVPYGGVVNERNQLFIPQFGVFDMAKSTLSQATEVIKKQLQRRNNTLGDIFVSLSRIKSVSVVISGAGVTAGTYQVSGNLRVLDAVKIACHDTLPDLSRINLRMVELLGRDTSYTIDLARFLSIGSLKDNPYVSSGLNIHLSFIHEYVLVSGEVQSFMPQKVPLRPGESIADALELFSFNPDADSAAIILQRQGVQPGIYSLANLKGVNLSHLDCIIVPPKKNRKQLYTVKVSGEVQQPGVYAIVPNQSTVGEIVLLAGGLTQLGDISRGYVIRRTMATTISTRPAGTAITSIQPAVTLGAKNMVESRDFTILPFSSARKIALLADDEIIIPQKQKSVYLSGCVLSSGAVDYLEGAKIDYYLKQAGGITQSGDKNSIRIVSFFGQSYKVRQRSSVEPGDVIIVPEKEPDHWVRKWSPIIQLISTSISVGLSVYGIYTIFDSRN